MEEAAMKHATEADLLAMDAPPQSPPNTSSEELVRRAEELLALLEAQRHRLESAEADAAQQIAAANEQKTKYSQELSALEKLQTELTTRNEELLEREKKLKEDEKDQNHRYKELLQRELDADAGFLQRERKALEKIETEAKTLQEQLSFHRKNMNEERATFEKKLHEERVSFEKKLHEERKQLFAEIEAQRAQNTAHIAERRANAEVELASLQEELRNEGARLCEEAARLRTLSRNLDCDRELLEEDREALNEMVTQRAAREVELQNGKIRALSEQLDAAREERDRLSRLLTKREEADRVFGCETPDEVLKRMQKLEAERDQLRKDLGERPSIEEARKLEQLVREKEQSESDRLQLLAELGEARQEATRKRIAVTELESLRDEKRALESANALLHEANRQLREEVDTLVKGIEGKSPFPSCSQMDTDNGLQSTRPTTDKLPKLADFSEYIRNCMAWDPKTKKELYYSAEDVRSFLGGLAMSRLHLLQGISGTGKTSLPLAFARAIGAGTAVIEVQAGWRDRQDLIGHFNTFERRFYESEFLQAIYRASTPCYRDTPFIVVLDEMNLSHPEQYFADLLSALEQEQQRQRLVLMTAAVDPAPRLLVEGGTKIPIPPNVWFIGTANHDETTKDFADKTYDRAHVMELPRNRETFKRRDVPPQIPMSLEALQTAFSNAVQTHKGDFEKAYQFLQGKLGDTLGRRFRIGWGNRLERQLGFYVPVVVASGGSVGEATDHILATKLLRKIRDRHDNRPEDIIALRERIQTDWSLLDKRHEPRRSLTLLQDELQRLGHDDD